MNRIIQSTAVLVVCCTCGCHHFGNHFAGMHVVADPPRTLGASIDELNMAQEQNAEPAKAIVYQHEFELNAADNRGWRLNEYGEDHVKQIAASLRSLGSSATVVVERSQTSAKPETEFGYPVHFNEELDEIRRKIVVNALLDMGVVDAEERVIVAPAYPEGITGPQAIRAYRQSQIPRTRSGFGGGGFGGGGLGGGFGGVGGVF